MKYQIRKLSMFGAKRGNVVAQAEGKRGLQGARRGLLLAAAVAAAFVALPASAQGSDPVASVEFAANLRLNVFGLTTDNRLVLFKVATPHIARTVGTITGLQSPDTSLVGIDFRVQNGLLYGVGNKGGIYIIDTNTAVASQANVAQLTVPLDPKAQFFGVDFNPAADRLRIVSDQGQNLSHNVNAGGTTQQQDPLATVAFVNNQNVRTPASGVSAAAYTNNDLPATTNTTLFVVNPNNDQMFVQSPPSTGNLQVSGNLGVDAGPWAGFDIYTRLVNGVSSSNSGFAALFVGGKYGFYHMNLYTGKATLVRNFNDSVVDVALPLNQ